MAGTDGPPPTIARVGTEITRIFEPLVEAVEAADDGNFTELAELFVRSGITEIESIETVYSTLQSTVETYQTINQDFVQPIERGENIELEAIETAIEDISTLIEDVKKLDDLPIGTEDVTAAGEQLIDFLLVRYLFLYRRDVHEALALVGVIDGGYNRDWMDIDLTLIERLLDDSTGVLPTLLSWGTEELDQKLLLEQLQGLASEFGIPANVASQSFTEIKNNFQLSNTVQKDVNRYYLTIPLFSIPTQAGLLYGALELYTLPETKKQWGGFAIVPMGEFSGSKSKKIGNHLRLTSKYSMGTQQDFGLTVRAKKEKQTPFDADLRRLGGGTIGNAHGEVTLEYLTSGSQTGGKDLLNSPDARLLVKSLNLKGIFDYSDDGVEYKVEFPASSRLEITPKGGFVGKVLPDQINTDFEVTAGMSTKDDLYFDSSATLEIPIPLHESLGPITLKEIFLSVGVDTDTGKITAVGAASAGVKLGPIVGTVDRIGVEADIKFPEKKGGNLGPIDLELGFKPPRGAGLSIAAGSAAKGGGYLFYDDEKERYGGTAQIKVPGGLSLSAIGLITTELPDGSDGFSMFVMIAGEFTPVPIGAGFTLNGVGGLLGINRRFRKKALGDVIRKGNLQSVLFPENVVENAKQIISDMRRMFPPKRGVHLFGPMVKIGYGSPTTVEFSLGVVLEIPTWRIAILGRMELGLPGLDLKQPPGTPKAVPWPQVKINLDVLGIIDIPGKEIRIDATIYDSWVLTWTVKGDMALRARWGKNSQFLLSIGGFYPAYPPPKNVPDLTRVTVALDLPGSTPKISFKGYMAVTSNTFQVGAKVHAEIDKDPIYVSGTLGFDALFQFSPFQFRFDFLAKFKFEVGEFKMAAKVEGRITGPSPMRIRGKARLNPPGPGKVKGNFDVKLGKDSGSSEIPDASVLPAVLGAFEEPKNWETALPRDGESPISLVGAGKKAKERAKQSGSGKQKGEAPAPVKAHPMGKLQVSQGTAPLEYTIEKFGEAKPGTYNRFKIDSLQIGRTGTDENTAPVEGKFAPAKYKPMDSKEKLSSPDFVEKTAGTTVGTTGVFVGGEETAENATYARFIYEEQVHDREMNRRGEAPMLSGDQIRTNVVHSTHTAKRLVADRASSQTDTKGRFSVGVKQPSATNGTGEGAGGGGPVRVGGDGDGRFSLQGENRYVVVDQRSYRRLDELQKKIAASIAGEEDGNGTDGRTFRVEGSDQAMEEKERVNQIERSGMAWDEAQTVKKQLTETTNLTDDDVAVVSKREFDEAVSDQELDDGGATESGVTEQ